MDLKELYQAYKVKKLAFEAAKKEEEKYKKLLKDAMAEAGEKDYTDEDGYRFECYSSDRKSIDEERLLAELHERELNDCISFTPARLLPLRLLNPLLSPLRLLITR